MAKTTKTENKEEQALVPTEPQKSVNLTNSERFTDKVLAEFQGNIGELSLSEYQKQLIKSYFIGIDNALKKADEYRVQKNGWNTTKEKNDLPMTWANVNMTDIATAVVHNAKLGLDMSIANHLSVVPYKNKANKYDLGFIPGYKGLEYIAIQHSLYPIKDIIVELIYSNDEFEVINNGTKTSYKFTIKNPFDRGEILGGFGYINYFDEEKNKLIMLNKKEIEKRKPKYAAAEFWGGEKYNSETKKKEEIEGWYEKMAKKTVARATYNEVSLDPKKINNSYAYVINSENRVYEQSKEDIIAEEIYENANKEVIDVDIETGEIKEEVEITEEMKESMFPPVNDEPTEDKPNF